MHGHHEIIGDDMQAVILSLGQGDAVRAEAGAMMFMTEGVDMDAKMDGGVLGGLKRDVARGGELLHHLVSLSRRRRRASHSPGRIPARSSRSS